tara:strand:+ start:24 stop:1499 length:1476 start_codon:yes stop_codon:yes gene_type:complete
MKCHCFIQACLSGVIEIDKKIPFLKKLYPNSEIEKKTMIGMDKEFVIVKDIVDDAKLITLDNVDCDLKLHIDFYSTALLGYSFIDIQFEIDEEMANKIHSGNIILKSKMLFNGKEQSVSNIIATILWPYFESEKVTEIMTDEKFMKLNKVDYEAMSEEILDKVGIKFFYSGEGINGGMGAAPGSILIEDYENKIAVDKWVDIGAYENQMFHHEVNKRTFILKEKVLYKEFYMVLIELQMWERFLSYSSNSCSSWLGRISNKVASIRKNINSNHENKFYWQELKRNIEVIDLNFLEFHTALVKECIEISGFPDTMDLEFSKYFIELNKEKNRQAKEALFRYLDEIKYAIRNLSTPGHTNDEHLLQAESEITNERILLLSFLAMSIPMLGAIFSPDFSWTTKIISATILFSLPIIYLLIRRIQKSLAYKRNIKEELGRQYKSVFSSIEKDKKRMKLLESMEDLPEDLRNSILDLDRKGMESAEKRLRKLEKYK